MIRDNYLDVSKLTTSPQILALFKLISKHGGVLRFVGGAVRDALKGINGHDLNLATDLTPEEIAEACADEEIETVPLGIKQGEIGIIIDNQLIEVSSLHKNVLQKNGSTKIEFTDNWEEDASRRDLTINAVYADECGNVFDYYNGIEDLEKGYVRFIGSAPERIREDYVRILRYFRFYSLFGLEEPNQKAVDACRENAAGLKKVPMEKIRDELFKIIQTNRAGMAYRLMQQNNILSYIMPDAEHIDDLEFINTQIKTFTLNNAAVVKMFILYRPNKVLAENMANRLKFSRHEKYLFTSLADTNISLSNLLNPKQLMKTAYQFGKEFCQAKLITEIAATRQNPENLRQIYQNMDNLSELELPIKGKDILEYGLTDQHKIGKILKELEQVWIDSDFDLTKEQLLLYIDTLKDAI